MSIDRIYDRSEETETITDSHPSKGNKREDQWSLLEEETSIPSSEELEEHQLEIDLSKEEDSRKVSRSLRKFQHSLLQQAKD